MSEAAGEEERKKEAKYTDQRSEKVMKMRERRRGDVAEKERLGGEEYLEKESRRQIVCEIRCVE